MGLQIGLADFQLVHPTETETVTTKFNTGQFEPDAQGVVRAVVNDISRQRRKPVPISQGQVVIKDIVMVGKKDPQDLAWPIDPATGRCLCGVMMEQAPQLPMDCDFEVYGPKGLIERGKVRCGGNEAVQTREVVLQVA